MCVCIMYAGTESVKAQHGRIGSGVVAPAGAQMADGSKPTDAGQAGSSKGGVFTTACMRALVFDYILSYVH